MALIESLEEAQQIIFEQIKKANESVESLKKELQYIQYLNEIGWPLFLYNHKSPLREEILDANSDKERCVQIVSQHLDSEFWDKTATKWSQSAAIKDERKAILLEAVQLHKEKRYYASVSILMCQVYGIASDITDILNNAGLIPEERMKKLVANYYNIGLEYIDKEKGKLFQAISFTRSGAALWVAAGKYLKENVLSSSESMSRWEHEPIRNKICHGDQLNFGTQEHSLKALLTADILVQMADEILRYTNRAGRSKQSQENVL